MNVRVTRVRLYYVSTLSRDSSLAQIIGQESRVRYSRGCERISTLLVLSIEQHLGLGGAAGTVQTVERGIDRVDRCGPGSCGWVRANRTW